MALNKGTDMKKMAHLYLLIIVSGSSFAMHQQNPMHERSLAQEPIAKDTKVVFVKKDRDMFISSLKIKKLLLWA